MASLLPEFQVYDRTRRTRGSTAGRCLLMLPVLLTLCSVTVAAAEPAVTVILVRHAERTGEMSADGGLSEAGRCRAEALARMLADANVRQIYTSELARIKETAAPVAKKLNIQPQVVRETELDGLALKLRAAKPGENILVVGRSSTLPEIIRRLGGGSLAPIGDGEYDRLLVVTLTGPKQATVVTLRYAGCKS